MATLTTTRSYDDGEVLVRADLDAFLDDIETFLNVTKINDDNIQNSGITGSTKLLNQSVTAAKLASDAVTTLKIADGSITTAKIGDDQVTTAKLADDSVTADILADDVSVDANRAVTTNHIRDLNVTTGKIAADAVTNAKLADDAVQTENILASAVTTAKINDAAVTRAKLSVNYASATLTASRAVAGTTYSLASALTTSGRPVRVTIWGGDYSAAHSSRIRIIRYDGVSTYTSIGSFALENSGGTTTGTVNLSLLGSGTPSDVQPSFTYLDIPAAASWQYGVELFVNGAGVVSITALKILIEEI